MIGPRCSAAEGFGNIHEASDSGSAPWGMLQLPSGSVAGSELPILRAGTPAAFLLTEDYAVGKEILEEAN
jgi:hypothetical protein